jgi:hypothetical protein
LHRGYRQHHHAKDVSAKEIASREVAPTSFKLDLDREELLALLSYMTIGLNYAAFCSGERAFLSATEIDLHLKLTNSQRVEGLQAKVSIAVEAVDPAQSKRNT